MIFNRKELIDDEGTMGSNSIQKFGAEHGRECVYSKDKRNIWGQCKGKVRVSDVYSSVELAYPNAKAARMLSFGGACTQKDNKNEIPESGNFGERFSRRWSWEWQTGLKGILITEQQMIMQSWLMSLWREIIQMKAEQNEVTVSS